VPSGFQKSPQLGRYIDPNYTSMESLVNDAALANMETDILSNTGQFRARVLYAWEEEVEGDSDSFWANITREATKRIVKVKARILMDDSPVHHFTLPQPRVLPLPNTEDPNNTRGVDWPAINQHPTYVAKHLGLPLPNPGDIIYVGYSSTGNGGPDGVGTDPIYVSPVESQGVANLGEMMGGEGGSPFVAFNGATTAFLGALGGPAFDPSKGTIVETVKAEPYKENRVRLFSFGKMQPNSPLLVDVPVAYESRRGTMKGKLHVLAAARFNAMNEAFMRETKTKRGFKVLSGTRPQWPFPGATIQDYYKAIIKKYRSDYPGKPDSYVFAKGSALKAYNSPHQTGLAMDLYYVEGKRKMTASSSTRAQQAEMKAFKWLKGNAHRFGMSPLKSPFEPWHWEVLIPRASWATGEEFTKDYYVRVVETSITPYPEDVIDNKKRKHTVQGKKLATNNKVFAYVGFA